MGLENTRQLDQLRDQITKLRRDLDRANDRFQAAEMDHVHRLTARDLEIKALKEAITEAKV